MFTTLCCEMFASIATKLFLFLLVSGVHVHSLILDRPDLRLAGGGNPFEGRIELLYNDKWSRVCFSEFDMDAAEIVCQYLGINNGAMSVWTNPPNDNSVPILNAEVERRPCLFVRSPVDCLDLDETDDNCNIIGVKCNFPGYMGCFAENGFADNERCFHSESGAGIPGRTCPVDIANCIRRCTSSGYRYAGVTKGNQCRCDSNSIPLTPEQNRLCDYNCANNASQKCGGMEYVGIYSTTLGACGGTFSTREGSITSPRFPDQYAEDQECDWTISVPDTLPTIKLSILMFELGGDRSNEIQIEYRDSRSRKKSVRLRGSDDLQLPHDISIPSNELDIEFKAKGRTDHGFVITYEAIPLFPVITTKAPMATTKSSTVAPWPGGNTESGDVTTQRNGDITKSSTSTFMNTYNMVTSGTGVGSGNMGMTKSLDTGVIVGIAIAVLLAIIVVVIIILCVRKRKPRKTKQPDGMYQTPETVSRGNLDNAVYGGTSGTDPGNYFSSTEPTYAEIGGRPGSSRKPDPTQNNPKYLHLSTFDRGSDPTPIYQDADMVSPSYQDADMATPSYQDFGGAAQPGSTPQYYTLERDQDPNGLKTFNSAARNGQPTSGGVYLDLQNHSPSEYMHLQPDKKVNNSNQPTSPKYFTLERESTPGVYTDPDSNPHTFFSVDGSNNDDIPTGDYEGGPPSSAGPYSEVPDLSPPQSAGPYTDLDDIQQPHYQPLSKESRNNTGPQFVKNVLYESADASKKDPGEYEYVS